MPKPSPPYKTKGNAWWLPSFSLGNNDINCTQEEWDAIFGRRDEDGVQRSDGGSDSDRPNKNGEAEDEDL